MIKKFLRRGSRGRNNFQNVPPSAGPEVFAGETFFTLREEKNYPSRIYVRGGENILKIVFSPDPSFKNFLIFGI